MEIKEINILTNKSYESNDDSYIVNVTNADGVCSSYCDIKFSDVFDLVCELSSSNLNNDYKPPIVRLHLSV